MSQVFYHTILELEVLEDRCAPTAITVAPSTVHGTSTTQSNPFGVTSPIVSAAAARAGSKESFASGSPFANTNEPGPSIPGVAPLGAGAGPLNGSIPDGAKVQSSSAGLSSLSPFLPTYYLSYTQVGPFYTGSGGVITKPTSTSTASLDQAAVDGSLIADASPAPATSSVLLPEAEWLAALLPGVV